MIWQNTENYMQHAVHTYKVLVYYFEKPAQTPHMGNCWCCRNVLASVLWQDNFPATLQVRVQMLLQPTATSISGKSLGFWSIHFLFLHSSIATLAYATTPWNLVWLLYPLSASWQMLLLSNSRKRFVLAQKSPIGERVRGVYQKTFHQAKSFLFDQDWNDTLEKC